jgi:peptidyl-prolyl cis-trans isomerase D
LTNDSEKKALADSIETAVRRGADFEALVTKYTDDPASIPNGGVYDWFSRGEMVPEFENFSFDERIGAIGTVKTTYGYHVVEVLDRRSTPMKKTVDLVKNIVPSSKTYKTRYQEANAFAIDNDSPELFTSKAEELGLKTRAINGTLSTSQGVSGVPDSREVVQWSYEADRKIGDVSSPIEAGDKFIVALMTGSREDGIPAYEDVLDDMKNEVAKEKKAEMFISAFGKYANLDEAAANAGVAVQSGSGLSMNAVTVPGGGREPGIVGTVFSMNEGDISTPLTGDFGVYVVQIKSKQDNTGEGVDLTSNRASVMNQYRSQVGVLMNKALNDARGVKNDISRVY